MRNVATIAAIELRRFLRDYEQHIEQLARAIETGEDPGEFNPLQWVSSVFLHAGAFHLIGNMIFLLVGICQLIKIIN